MFSKYKKLKQCFLKQTILFQILKLKITICTNKLICKSNHPFFLKYVEVSISFKEKLSNYDYTLVVLYIKNTLQCKKI